MNLENIFAILVTTWYEVLVFLSFIWSYEKNTFLFFIVEHKFLIHVETIFKIG